MTIFQPTDVQVVTQEWTPTQNLRFRVASTTQTPRLQQEWVNKSTGATEWRNVPVTIGA